MKGHPKYNIGDIVKFKMYNKVKTGIIKIVDVNGNFYDGTDVSYDIFNEKENIIYKHCMEFNIIGKL